jgi:hypothetical protein
MATTIMEPKAQANYYVVHPLDDVPEKKMSPDGLGLMEMSGSVKTALVALRTYMLFIVVLAFYRLATLGFIAIHHAH